MRKSKKHQGVPMYKLKEVIRLHSAGLSQHQLAKSLNLSVGAVNKYLQRIKSQKLDWAAVKTMSEAELEALLKGKTERASAYRIIDTVKLHQELKRHKHVTLQLLWEEYCTEESEAPPYSYAQFCRYYRDCVKRQSPSMRQTHIAGEKAFIDYSGDTVSIINPHTGEIRKAELFVAVLGASNYTFAEATWSQRLPDWIASHVRMFEFFGGVPKLLVPDNLKSAIIKACYYEPNVNRTYTDLAQHYDTAVLPARPRKPKDKAKVENAVLVVQRWILARLRHHTFSSFAELNQVIKELLINLNQRPFKKLPGCRESQFLNLDKPALQALPEKAYEFVEFKLARVNLDYHIEVEKHYYSVPHQLIKEEVHVRLSNQVVEIYHKHKQVAVHPRSQLAYKYSTIAEHMPKAHQYYHGWTPGKFLNQAIKIGPKTRDVVKQILDSKKHPEQGFRACQGLLRLTKPYSETRLEKACERALSIGSPSRRSVVSILEKGLDQVPNLSDEQSTDRQLPSHENIRGAEYYQSTQQEEHSWDKPIR